jgi:hypothetical protein
MTAEAAMHKLVGVTIGLITLAMSPPPRAPAKALTLRVESMTARPATFTVWTNDPRHIDSARAVDSVTTATTPASISLDSATREIRILTRANAPVRVQVLEDSRELQHPANAWGRELRLRRVDDLFQVVFDARFIQPR